MLLNRAMSVMMSDMKTKTVSKKPTSKRAKPTSAANRRSFTVRELNRQPQAVLNAARRNGGVHVQSRTGERFLLKPDPAASPPAESAVQEHLKQIRDLHARMKADGMGFTAEGWEVFSKMLAGE